MRTSSGVNLAPSSAGQYASFGGTAVAGTASANKSSFHVQTGTKLDEHWFGELDQVFQMPILLREKTLKHMPVEILTLFRPKFVIEFVSPFSMDPVTKNFDFCRFIRQVLRVIVFGKLDAIS